MVRTKKVYIRDGRAPVPEKEVTSRVMSAIKAKNTKPEKLLREALWQSDIRGYRLHWKKVPGKPDIAFPGRKIAVFVNGCYWHRCPLCSPPMPKTHIEFWEAKFYNNKKRDIEKINKLEKMGWRVIVIWECQIKKDMGFCVGKITSMLNSHNNKKI